jgi:5-methylcytosine-specific restriction endonuclease McrA
MPYKDADKRKEYQRRYREEHATELLAASRVRSARYYDEHREAVLERCAQYYQDNKEQCLKRNQAYYAEHHDQFRKWNHDYNLEHPECSANKRARRKARLGDAKLTKTEWIAVMTEWDWRCAYCGNRLTRNTRSVDHVVPLECGGPHSRWNLVPACRNCNSSKHDSLPHTWRNCPILTTTTSVVLWKIVLVNLPLDKVVLAEDNQW